MHLVFTLGSAHRRIIPSMPRSRHHYCVYIMTNRSKTLYVGFSSNLEGRVWKHKNKIYEGFTCRYHVDRLVYYEDYSRVGTALAREKQLKGWRRLKKIALIVSMNPTWRDLSEDWGKPIQLAQAQNA